MSTNIIPARKDIAEGPDRQGDAPMTDVQAVRLRDLAERTGEPFDAQLTQRQADRRIAALEEMARD